MPIALTREVSESISACELTHVAKVPIDLEIAHAQHQAYEAALSELGCRVVRLPDLPHLPDAVFVQDAAVVFDEVAIIARPGAKSRRAEVDSVAKALQEFRPLKYIEEPGTLDGGDVVPIGRVVFVGQSSRTNKAGAEQLALHLNPFGYDVRPVPISACLHLMSAVTAVADDTVLINRNWVDGSHFAAYELIDVDPSEPFAANALRIGARLIFPLDFPRTRERLQDRGFPVRALEMSELAKAEGAVTCCSIVFEDRPGR